MFQSVQALKPREETFGAKAHGRHICWDRCWICDRLFEQRASGISQSELEANPCVLDYSRRGDSNTRRWCERHRRAALMKILLSQADHRVKMFIGN